MTNFVYVQKTLEHQISIQIEEAMGHLKDLLYGFWNFGWFPSDFFNISFFREKLNNTNYTFNNKLSQLEANTNANYLSLDDEDSDLVRGSGTVPRLDALLQASLAFATFFSQSLRTINDNFKRLNIKDERTLRRIQQSLCLDFNDKIVTYLLALTQYVDNEAAVIWILY